jgi:hypothetical protein
MNGPADGPRSAWAGQPWRPGLGYRRPLHPFTSPRIRSVSVPLSVRRVDDWVGATAAAAAALRQVPRPFCLFGAATLCWQRQWQAQASILAPCGRVGQQPPARRSQAAKQAALCCLIG